MKKRDSAIIRETCYIAVAMLILSTIMELIFVLVSAWNYTVLLGNLLSIAVSVLNFYLMGRSIQTSLGKEEKAASDFMQFSQVARFLMLVCTAIVGVTVPIFNMWTVLIPLLFPRIAIAFRPMIGKFCKSMSMDDTSHEGDEM